MKFIEATLQLERVFSFSTQQVFATWTQADQLIHWFFTTPETNQGIKNEPYLHGSWEVIDERAEGMYRMLGKYMSWQEPTQLTLTFTIPQLSQTTDLLSIELLPHETGCTMQFTQKLTIPCEMNWSKEKIQEVSNAFITSAETGWQHMFQKLENWLEVKNHDK